MSKANPRKAMTALLPLPIGCGEGVVVRPMTLGMWAALERIGSPLVTGDDKADALALLPSLYLLTHEPAEVFKGNIVELAMDWADTVPVSTMEMIRRAAYRQMNAAFDVIPEDDTPEPKKKKTDGWVAFLAEFAAREYGWSYREILWEVPLSVICLFRRREGLKENKIVPLQVIEEIDNG